MSEKIEVCHVKGCGEATISRGYCRLHYIQYWRQIQIRKQVGSERLLSRVKEAMIRDHIEGTQNLYLRKVQKNENLDRLTLNDLIGEIRTDRRVCF